MKESYNRCVEFRIQGMDCAKEVALLKRELVPLVGEDSLEFDLLNAKLTVVTSATSIGQSEIEAAIKRSGLTAFVWKDKPERTSESFWSQHKRTILTATSGIASLVGFVIESLSIESSSASSII